MGGREKRGAGRERDRQRHTEILPFISRPELFWTFKILVLAIYGNILPLLVTTIILSDMLLTYITGYSVGYSYVHNRNFWDHGVHERIHLIASRYKS